MRKQLSLPALADGFLWHLLGFLLSDFSRSVFAAQWGTDTLFRLSAVASVTAILLNILFFILFLFRLETPRDTAVFLLLSLLGFLIFTVVRFLLGGTHILPTRWTNDADGLLLLLAQSLYTLGSLAFRFVSVIIWLICWYAKRRKNTRNI